LGSWRDLSYESLDVNVKGKMADTRKFEALVDKKEKEKLDKLNERLPDNLYFRELTEITISNLHCRCGYPDVYNAKWYVKHKSASLKTCCPACNNTGHNILKQLTDPKNIRVGIVVDGIAEFSHSCGKTWQANISSVVKRKNIFCPECPKTKRKVKITDREYIEEDYNRMFCPKDIIVDIIKIRILITS
jgi:hypothetical protein